MVCVIEVAQESYKLCPIQPHPSPPPLFVSNQTACSLSACLCVCVCVSIKIKGTMVSAHGWETGTAVKLSDFSSPLTVRTNREVLKVI